MGRDVLLPPLARNWAALLYRAALAMAYGVAVFAWPNIAFGHFVYLFGVYALLDGIVALAIAVDVLEMKNAGWLFGEAFVRIGGGLVAMGEPAVVLEFPRFLAIWALLAGVADALVAVALRRELAREWPLPFAAAISALVAVWLLVWPGELAVAATSMRWLLGPYAILVGVSLLAFARRLRQLAHEMPAASGPTEAHA